MEQKSNSFTHAQILVEVHKKKKKKKKKKSQGQPQSNINSAPLSNTPNVTDLETILISLAGLSGEEYDKKLIDLCINLADPNVILNNISLLDKLHNKLLFFGLIQAKRKSLLSNFFDNPIFLSLFDLKESRESFTLSLMISTWLDIPEILYKFLTLYEKFINNEGKLKILDEALMLILPKTELFRSVAILCLNDETLNIENKVNYLLEVRKTIEEFDIRNGYLTQLETNLGLAKGPHVLLKLHLDSFIDDIKLLEALKPIEKNNNRIIPEAMLPLILTERKKAKFLDIKPLPIIDDEYWKDFYITQFDLVDLETDNLLPINHPNSKFHSYLDMYDRRRTCQDMYLTCITCIKSLLVNPNKLIQQPRLEETEMLQLNLYYFYERHNDYSAGFLLADFLIKNAELPTRNRLASKFSLEAAEVIVLNLIKKNYNIEACNILLKLAETLKEMKLFQQQIESYRKEIIDRQSLRDNDPNNNSSSI